MDARLRRARLRKAPRSRLALLVTLALGATASYAGTASQPFAVQVDIAPAETTATCSQVTTLSGKANVSIDCAPAAPARATAPPHLLLHIFREADWIGTVDGVLATGTVTSWRVVRFAQREYLEMTVGW